ncbi:MAG: regulatory iron-sulfur-containing complex subunit RicT [Kiritimatiellae bacterium]|jgi:cell fate regulator YaaT (PSP1 superfamily)|nr:regulatory iron-sulfur-containing complex subunit RicT [Kiritimatiellia bacterium]
MNYAQILTPEYALFYCRVNPGVDIYVGRQYVVEFDYGMDMAELIEYGDLQKGVKNFRIPGFRIIRAFGDTDIKRTQSHCKVAKEAQAALKELLQKDKVRAKIVHCRMSLDRNRLFVRYCAKSSLNLNRYAEPLRRKFNASVNFWQIGARDECRLIGCIGTCGRQSCCSSWQKRESVVTLKMAKTQGIPLNPASLNGTCNRLKCCLKYENHVYEEAGTGLPENGAKVICTSFDNKKGVIINRDILRKKLVVRTRDGKFMTVAADEVTLVKK